MTRANPDAPSTIDPSLLDISPEAMYAVDQAEDGDTFSVDQLLDDWPDPADDSEFHADQLQETRNQLIRDAVARLDQIFATQLDTLRFADAGHPVCLELSQITKLTFLRVKESPAAWDALGTDDYATVVRSLRVMADKRRSGTANAKNKKAAAKELEAVSSFDHMFDAMDAAMSGGLSL